MANTNDNTKTTRLPRSNTVKVLSAADFDVAAELAPVTEPVGVAPPVVALAGAPTFPDSVAVGTPFVAPAVPEEG